MANLYQCSEPYPIPTNLGCNRRTGRLLLEVYCGRSSELTEVCQLAFSQSEAQLSNGTVAQTLQGICRVDLQHLTMLGTTIQQVGVRPVYRTIREDGPCFWTARFCTFCNNLREMLEADIRLKERCIHKYNCLIREISNTQINALLRRIIEDERLHIELLLGLLNTYG